ncbi:monooxygenase [Methylobacterium sp. BTF04]|uniref:FAD-dependent monooxygenase n=1 Tax=Methylobacterium sp. BTF04 TaxID=2708300 RepID=UPI0013D2AC9A|nr:FAD-dependent monooxygenase [Methylobacterium sp. BTF04]NEU13497.1 monooxygenase [Methylobacterium sp. BTF04]
MNPQVLVCGAGPVGLTMAAELARYGVGIRIIDRAAQRTDKSKALVLWSRTLELLDRSGCSGAFVAAGHRVEAANLIAGDRRVGHVSLAAIDSPYPYALMLPQSETERLLEAHLASLGIRVEREVELAGFTDNGEGVTANLTRADESAETLTVDWLIGCDGAHSTVRHTLGLPFGGETLRSDWILADVHVTGMKTPFDELVIYFHEDGVLVLFPITPGRYRIIADVGRSEGLAPADPTLDAVQRIVDRRGPDGLHLSDPIWLSAFRINERKVETYRAGRVFVAGDAAHVHSPAGGQGMNTGMQDAFNLAWKLALICRGTVAGDRLLDSYGVERSTVGAQVLTAASRMTALAVIKNPAAQAVRNWIGGLLFGLSPVRRTMANTLSEISIGYPHSPLTGPGLHGLDGPAPGERVRPIPDQAPIGEGAMPRFALFGRPDPAIDDLLREHGDLLEPDLRPPLADDSLWLVRPDGYVACVATDADVGRIDDYLKALSR